MKQFFLKHFGIKVALAGLLLLPELAAGQFTYNQYGDVLAGFRKTGVNEGSYELVVDLGSVTNFLKLSIGTTINITNFSTSQLTNAFADTGDFANLQWSAFATFPGSVNPWTTPVGSFPVDTLWLTLPGTSVASQTQPPKRNSPATQANTRTEMLGVGGGASSISGYAGVVHTAFLVQEPVTYTIYYLTAFIGDAMDTSLGDFGANHSPLPYIVENTTAEPFNAPQRDDFYQLCPSGKSDPINGSTTNTYFVGYFILNPNGSMTFTRAAQAAAAPVASFTGGPTNGFAGFSAVFTNTSTGNITNWVWNFGDGTFITNTTGADVTHTYVTGGNYDVTLTVSGPDGSDSQLQPSLITTSPLPTLIARISANGGLLTFGGTNCPAGVQYRLLKTTNLALPLPSWIPVVTNVFLNDGTWTYTTSTTGPAGFFRLASP